MPFSSAIWDDWMANDVKPTEFHAEENGERIDYITKSTKEE